jgi:hypothetical protein
MYYRPLNIPYPAWVTFAFGVAGLVVFARRGTIARPVSKPPTYAPLPGDGTNTVLNKLIVTAATVGAVVGSTLWSHWASSHGLPSDGPPLFYLQLLPAVLLILVIHESGHAIAGMAVG